jgi:molecular chaperone GrpE
MSDKKKVHSAENSSKPMSSGSFGSAGVGDSSGKAKKNNLGKGGKGKDHSLDAQAVLELKHGIQKLEEKNALLVDENKRLQAEIQNIFRRHNEEIAHTRSHAVQRVVEDVIGLLDGFDACLKTFEDSPKGGDIKSIEEGIHMTHRMFMSVLSRYEVKTIEPQVGDVFDPHQHEAMAQIDDAKAKPKSIVQVIQKGYRLKDRVIRSARVILAK